MQNKESFFWKYNWNTKYKADSLKYVKYKIQNKHLGL